MWLTVPPPVLQILHFHMRMHQHTLPCAKIERFSVPIEIEREAVSPVRDPSRRTRFYAPRKPVQARFTRERILPYPPRGNALYGLSGSMYDAPYTLQRLCATCKQRRERRAELGRQARLQHVVNGPEGSPNIERTFGNKDSEMQSEACRRSATLHARWNAMECFGKNTTSFCDKKLSDTQRPTKSWARKSQQRASFVRAVMIISSGVEWAS